MGDCSHGCCWFLLELYYLKSEHQRQKGEISQFNFLQNLYADQTDLINNA